MRLIGGLCVLLVLYGLGVDRVFTLVDFLGDAVATQYDAYVQSHPIPHRGAHGR
jgi:hypothetical protein